MAIAPAAFVLVAEGAAWSAVALTGSQEPDLLGAYAFGVAVVAAIVTPIALVLTRRRDAAMWVVVSLSTSVLGLFFGALLWLGAVFDHCHHVCLS